MATARHRDHVFDLEELASCASGGSLLTAAMAHSSDLTLSEHGALGRDTQPHIAPPLT
jgi:hypothetical protein